MNWGTKIVLGMIAFMLFIIGMVVYMFRVHDNDPLITEDYYEQGINYDDQYKAKEQVLNDNAEPKIQISESQIIIQLKDSAQYELKLLNPSSSKQDYFKKGTTIGDSNLIVIDKGEFKLGRWMLELKWNSGQKNYLYTKNVSL